jgi:hypothetical protein
MDLDGKSDGGYLPIKERDCDIDVRIESQKAPCRDGVGLGEFRPGWDPEIESALEYE